MSGDIIISFSQAEIKELDNAAYLMLRRMLREGVSSAERNDGSIKALVSASTKIHEQALDGANTPRMQDIRQMIAASDASKYSKGALWRWLRGVDTIAPLQNTCHVKFTRFTILLLL